MSLLKRFEVIKNELDAIAHERNIQRLPQYVDAVTAIDKLCKILMRDDFAKDEDIT